MTPKVMKHLTVHNHNSDLFSCSFTGVNKIAIQIIIPQITPIKYWNEASAVDESILILDSRSEKNEMKRPEINPIITNRRMNFLYVKGGLVCMSLDYY